MHAILIPQEKTVIRNMLPEEALVKSKAQRIANLLGYKPNGTLSKTIMKGITGSVVIVSVDTGVQLSKQNYPFDTYIQIVEGMAYLVINTQHQTLESGEGIILPAHSNYHFMASHKQFKMIVTVIKSGYED